MDVNKFIVKYLILFCLNFSKHEKSDTTGVTGSRLCTESKYTNKRIKRYDYSVPHSFSELDGRVGRIVDLKEQKGRGNFYILTLDMGGYNITVLNSIRNYMPEYSIRWSLVPVFVNLAPFEYLDVVSEGAIPLTRGKLGKELLRCPEESIPGDLIYCKGHARAPALEVSWDLYEELRKEFYIDYRKCATVQCKPWYVVSYRNNSKVVIGRVKTRGFRCVGFW